MRLLETAKKVANLIFPFFCYHSPTQVFVWRHALVLQRRLAQTVRHGALGHYYEFGVFRLRSIINFNTVRKLAAFWCKEFHTVKIYAFDSFQGLPPSTTEDVQDPEWHTGAYHGSLDDVKRLAADHRIPAIEFIQGYYQDSLTPALAARLKDFPPGLIHIDCDLYSSTIVVLQWLDQLALPGAIYFFDDLWKYHGHPEAGELKAIREYNENPSNRGLLVEDPLGMGSKMVYRFCPRNPAESTKEQE